jgi:succinate-semialdehyde dehydrogenase/glutarate-semialdehyde dehydrogenase
MVVNVKTTPTLEKGRAAPSQVAAVACNAPSQLFIGGEWVSAKAGRTFDVIDPSSADAIATVSASLLSRSFIASRIA